MFTCGPGQCSKSGASDAGLAGSGVLEGRLSKSRKNYLMAVSVWVPELDSIREKVKFDGCELGI